MNDTALSYSLTKQAQKLSWLIAAKNHSNFYQCRAEAKLMLQGSRAVKDPTVTEHLKHIFSKDLRFQGLNQKNNLEEFKQSMHQWIASHNSNRLCGLDNYDIDFSAGTTQSFDSFYYRHRDRRMRCFVGEYFYHLKTWISNQVNWSFVSDSDPLVTGDALVISLPFCDTGSTIFNFDTVLEQCNQLQIPVLIDCCYYPISGNIQAELNMECIDTVTFSLSKAFPIADLRIGLRYTRKKLFDGQKLHDSINYNNTLSAWIGLEIIKQFSSNYIYDTYRQRQLLICDYFKLVPSDSVLFASGDQSWAMYNRANLLKVYQLNFDPSKFNNRISLASILDNWELFEFLKDEHTTKI